MEENFCAIEMRGITKRFPGIVANDKVSIAIKNNEVHALLGENGAGKSTLMSILFGSYDADEGSIFLRGKQVHIKDPNTATKLGIGMVHQHFKLVHNYTVTENIVLGMESKNKWGFLDLKSAEKKVEELSKKYGLAVNVKERIEDLSVASQQRVEILKTLYRNADIIIFDEPTAVLTPQEIDELIKIIKRLKNEGKTIILITHKLKEIKALADRCTVLRRGKVIGTVDVANVTEERMAQMMVGRAVQFAIQKNPVKTGKVALELKNLCIKNARANLAVKNLSLVVKQGEILGIAGVDGNGQSELIYGITGLTRIESGTVLLDGKDITKASVRERIEAGLSHVPEDRQKYGIVDSFCVGENIVLKNYYKKPFSNKAGILQQDVINLHAEKLIKDFDIRSAEGALTPCGSMSGGNQQKVIVAREIELSPKVLIIAQPTRGLDVGAIEYIRGRILLEREKGRAILLVSFELDEIMNLCDRIATISKGEIVGTYNADELSEYDIGLMMAGEKKKDAR